MKISHEVPICLLDESKKFNDYDYALVHLFEEYPRYYDFFRRSVEEGREVILDNSIFELGEAFDIERFVYWIGKLHPTSYIIPDVLENYRSTISNATDWFDLHNNLPGEKIGVVQGKTYTEIVSCYRDLVTLGVDKIAISFDYSLYEKIFPHANKLVSWCFGRVMLINRLIEEDVINYLIPHHLLGCSLPQEFSYYKHTIYSFLVSVDTSNPITLSLDNDRYEDIPVQLNKPKTKLFKLIDTQITPEQYRLVLKNTKHFRNLIKNSKQL